jgi:hypothetical protein
MAPEQLACRRNLGFAARFTADPPGMLAQRAQSETEEGETRQSRSSPRARSRFAGDRGAPPHSSPIPSRHQARRTITTMSSMKPLSLLARIELLTGVRLRRWIAR